MEIWEIKTDLSESQNVKMHFWTGFWTLEWRTKKIK